MGGLKYKGLFPAKGSNKDKINENKIKKKLSTLTSKQKQCLLFLACAWLTKTKVIIKGKW